MKVRSFRAPEECGTTGLGEKKKEAREAWAGGVHAEEWSEESGRHGVGVVVGVVVFLGGMGVAVAIHVCGCVVMVCHSARGQKGTPRGTPHTTHTIRIHPQKASDPPPVEKHGPGHSWS